MTTGGDLTVFAARLGHVSRRPELLTQALTHRSAADPRRSQLDSNERLEFLGHRVLALLIAEWLAERFPEEREGDLGKRLGVLVARDTLTGVADSLGLASVLRVPLSEGRAGLRERANVLADAVEALLGALYLDGGLPPARASGAAGMGGADGRRPAAADVGEKPPAGIHAGPRAGAAGIPAGLLHRPVAPADLRGLGRRRGAGGGGHGRIQARGGTIGRRGVVGRVGAEMSEVPLSEGGGPRCGLVAVVGAPNAGKSTLVNALAGSKVTIVSPKPQTTRFRIRAVVMHQGAQLILVDTPGIFAPRRRLDRAMVAAGLGRRAGCRPHPADRRCPGRADRRGRAITDRLARCSIARYGWR